MLRMRALGVVSPLLIKGSVPRCNHGVREMTVTTRSWETSSYAALAVTLSLNDPGIVLQEVNHVP